MSLKQIEALKKINLDGSDEAIKSSTDYCICNRPIQDVLCHSCGYLFVGRVRKKCSVHQKAILLMDTVCCPKCRTDSLFEIKESETPKKGKSCSRTSIMEKLTSPGPPKVEVPKHEQANLLQSVEQNAHPKMSHSIAATTIDAKHSAVSVSERTPKPKSVDTGCQTEFPIQLMKDDRQYSITPQQSIFQSTPEINVKTRMPVIDPNHPGYPTQQSGGMYAAAGAPQNKNSNNNISSSAASRVGVGPAPQQHLVHNHSLYGVNPAQAQVNQTHVKRPVTSTPTQHTPVSLSAQLPPVTLPYGKFLALSTGQVYVPRQPVMLSPTLNQGPPDSQKTIATDKSIPFHQATKPIATSYTPPKMEYGSRDDKVSTPQKQVGVPDEYSILKRAIGLRRSSTSEYVDTPVSDRQF